MVRRYDAPEDRQMVINAVGGAWVPYSQYAALKEAVENYIDNMTHEFDSEYSLCSDPRIALAKILGRSSGDMQ